MEKTDVATIVVTYNRKELLLECVSALLKQTYKMSKIIIIDNNSTDGTYECLEENGYINDEIIIYKKLEKNIGGSGGFYEGMKLARELNPNWVWIMDDDTIPKKNALEELIKASKVIKDKVSFFASSVYGISGECMNVPKINMMPAKNGYPEWYRYLPQGIVKINEATFVSLLIKGEALNEIGLPIKEYFIWGDDTEYTMRLNKYYGNAYMVGNSEVIHKRKGGKALSLKDEDNKDRIRNYFYMIRNNYINTKAYKGKKDLAIYILKYHFYILMIIFTKSKHKWLKIRTILKGLYSAIFKKYNYKLFAKRLET